MPRRNPRRDRFIATYNELGGDEAGVSERLRMTKLTVRQTASRYRRLGLEIADPKRPPGAKRRGTYTGIPTTVNLHVALTLTNYERVKNESQGNVSAFVDDLLTAAFAARDAERGDKGPTGHALRIIVRRSKAEGKVWTERELLGRGLPLYLSKNWLLDKLSQGETYSSLARAHGWNFRTLAGYARREHGLEQHRTRADIYDLVTWPATVKQIADATDGDAVRAAKWASEAVADGRLVRVRRGLYELPERPLEVDTPE